MKANVGRKALVKVARLRETFGKEKAHFTSNLFRPLRHHPIINLHLPVFHTFLAEKVVLLPILRATSHQTRICFKELSRTMLSLASNPAIIQDDKVTRDGRIEIYMTIKLMGKWLSYLFRRQKTFFMLDKLNDRLKVLLTKIFTLELSQKMWCFLSLKRFWCTNQKPREKSA